MENVVFKYSDFFDDDGGLEKAKKDLAKTGEEIVDIAKQTKKDFNKAFNLDDLDTITKFEGKIADIVKAFEKYQKAVEDLDEAEKERQRASKERIKNESKLERLRKGELDDAIELRLELQKETKERKEQIKEKKGLNSLYQTESKRLNDLRKQYKDLRLSTGKSTDETEKLKKEIQELDEALKDVDGEVGQFQRNVGNYRQTASRAKAGIASLSGFLVGVFVANIEKSRAVSRQFQLTLEKIGSAGRTLLAPLVDYFSNVLVPSVSNIGLKFKSTGKEAKLFFLELVPESLRTGETTDQINEIKKSLEDLETQIKANDALLKGQKGLFERYEGVTKILKENNSELERLFILEAKNNDQRLITETRLVGLNGQFEKYQSKADDATRSFDDQQANLKKSLVFQEQILNNENTIAENNLKVAIARLNVNAKEQRLGEIVNRQNVDKLEFLKNFAVADKLQEENVESLIESLKAVQEIESRRAIVNLENARQEREISRDRYEQDLDFTIDVFDRQKSVNERLIGSDKVGLKEKQKIQDETERLLEKSFTNQIELTENFIASSLKSQGKTDQEVAEALEQISLRKLTALTDEEEVRKQLLDSGIVDEITQNRIREIILERKTFVQDLADTQNDINEKALEDQINLKTQRLEINQEVAEDTAERRIQDFDEEKRFNLLKFNSAVEALDKRKEEQFKLVDSNKQLAIDSALTEDEVTRAMEEAVNERLNIQKAYQDDVNALTKSGIEKRTAMEKEFAEEFNAIITLIGSAYEKKLGEDVSNAEKALEKQSSVTDKQEERAQEGLENTLAFEQREMGKREAELIKRQKREQQIQRLNTYWNTYNANVNSLQPGEDSSRAITKTLRDIAILEAITASFKEGGLTGIDGVNTNANGITTGKRHDANGKGGNLAWHERGEGFFSRKEVSSMGHANFYKLKNLASKGKIDSNFFTGQRESFIQQTNTIMTDPGLKEEMIQVRKAVESKAVPNWSVDKITRGTMNVVEELIGKNSVKRNHYQIKKPRP